MKLVNVPLGDITPNPWRDLKLFPLAADHVRELRTSINDHGFFASLKGRRVDGKVQIGCGHARIEAARKAGLETVPVYIDIISDDAMLRLMSVENATQSGANPGAVMNEVLSVSERLIDGLLTTGTIVPVDVSKAFDGGNAKLKEAIGKLRNGRDVHLVLGHNVIRRYLGQGDPDKSPRGDRQVREAITALKQSGRYDDMVEAAVLRHPPPTNAPPSTGKAVIKSEKPARRARILDERVANLFPNEHQFQAFRESVTTPAAQKVLPVENQYAIAKSIMKEIRKDEPDENFRKKGVGAPYIKKMVHYHVQEGMKAQREIDREEKEAYLREQREAMIDEVIGGAKSNVRSLISSLAKLIDLAKEYPAHPKLGGFSARLDTLVGAIQQFSKALK